jgi:hypothetical protein
MVKRCTVGPVSHFLFLVAFTVVVVFVSGSPARAIDFRFASWNFANNPDNATEDANVRTVLQAISNENVGGRVNRLDLLGAVETDTTSATRVTSILNSLYGAGTYAQFTSTADGGGDRPAGVYFVMRRWRAARA